MEESQLTEFREKEDFNRTEQLEQMGLQRPDQLLANQPQKALPTEYPSNNPCADVLGS